ncbi:MAG: hypothetical protein PHU70_01770 [Dehalococcoidia bacterium]|nr:hypothetical protein [Dehalococcoidia bacterium]
MKLNRLLAASALIIVIFSTVGTACSTEPAAVPDQTPSNIPKQTTIATPETDNVTSEAVLPEVKPQAAGTPVTLHKLVFISGTNDDEGPQMYTSNEDGSNWQRLTNNKTGGERFPRWSPDGKNIVFFTDMDGYWHIYSIDADGSNQIRLTNTDADDAFPAWSPDSQKIVFSSNRDGNDQIYVMNADGSNQV